jgi:carboxypeptidase C (cathepsin A)
MYEFLQHFFTEKPQFKDAPFFVTGESYGGHYVPAVANRIWKGNQQNEGLPINLGGAAIGNGFVNAELQYPQYIKYAQANNLLKSQMQEEIVKHETATCEHLLETQQPEALPICDLIVSTIQKFGGNFNIYDIRKKVKLFSKIIKIFNRYIV